MAAIEYRGLNAVTNFDLSRYIKWLKPNQENEITETNNIHQLQDDNTEIIPVQNLDRNLSINYFTDQQKPEISSSAETKNVPSLPGHNTTASSALGLLLQSSKFKEMLEMTSTGNDCPSMSSESEIPRGSFPDDIQTYFACHDSGQYGDGEDIIFGDLHSFASPMFQCGLDA